jgi:hypothetical protein
LVISGRGVINRAGEPKRNQPGAQIPIVEPFNYRILPVDLSTVLTYGFNQRRSRRTGLISLGIPGPTRGLIHSPVRALVHSPVGALVHSPVGALVHRLVGASVEGLVRASVDGPVRMRRIEFASSSSPEFVIYIASDKFILSIPEIACNQEVS